MSRLNIVSLLVAAALLLAPGGARADDPPYLGWTQLLPGLTTQSQQLGGATHARRAKMA